MHLVGGKCSGAARALSWMRKRGAAGWQSETASWRKSEKLGLLLALCCTFHAGLLVGHAGSEEYHKRLYMELTVVLTFSFLASLSLGFPYASASWFKFNIPDFVVVADV